ncbi:MAG: ATP-binding protein [Candidatus Bipolaricaulota bacterium]|nr:ATP-binding protein [Candidatus Bipolaricaulota bacterium]MCS7273849.1 ATP-binding protein [Candidatus Bipolaricaulota bacterium]MDW8110733.1 ATP-binding protein [Candidatus Bipolaricaulota bacterium]MDW8328409.1 ATP-binding protein [Candidatus Bipolaricaulota bacterium]
MRAFWHRLPFKYQLLGALALVTLVAVSVVYLLADQAIQTRFTEFRGRAGAAQARHLRYLLSEYYARYGSWQGLHQLLNAPGRDQRLEPPLVIADAEGVIVVSDEEQLLGQQLSPEDLALGMPIWYRGERVGTLFVRPPPRVLTPLEQQFAQSVQSAILLAGGVALIVAFVLGTVLMRRLAQPLTELRNAAEQIAQGHLETRVNVSESDELGRLGQAFNAMAQSLHRSEHLRRQMVLDIAHELRNPLMIQQSHLELLLDRVTELTPQQIETIYQQNLLLGRLVRDLQLLALADAGELPVERAPLSLAEVLQSVSDQMAPALQEKEITLQMRGSSQELIVYGDRQRLEQVLMNLLENARCYTPIGGTIRVSATAQGSEALVSVEDSGPGISPEDLPHLFDRFYRGDKSRARASGGTGLGLAIAKALVEAHNGKIWAENLPNGGARFSFTLPLALKS